MKAFKLRSMNPYSGMFEEYQKKVKDEKSKKVVVMTCLVSSAPRSVHDVPKSLPVEQFAGQKFMLNASGFPMNDILAFESVQSDQLARAVLARTQILDMPKNTEMPLEDQFAQIVPSNWSSPAEYVRACKKFGEYAYAKQMDAIRASHVVKTTDQNGNKQDVVVNTDPE